MAALSNRAPHSTMTWSGVTCPPPTMCAELLAHSAPNPLNTWLLFACSQGSPP